MPATRGRASLRALAYAMLLAGAMLFSFAGGAFAAAVPADFYGVNAGQTLFNDASQRPAAFAAMRSGGLTFVRRDASWDKVEPLAPIVGVHVYLWTQFDQFVADLARRGLRWYPMLGYSTPWTSSSGTNPFAPPARDADYAAFVTAFAKRYGTGGSFWAEHPELPAQPTTVYEIWNEPSNSDFWQGPQATPARYMRLYLAARSAIKSVDPTARVSTAGLLDSAWVDGNAYLRAMLDSVPAARNQIDAVGWHPYVSDADDALASVSRARATLAGFGMSATPIEISEVGWPSAVPTELRADWVRALAEKLPSAGLNVTRMMPYVWTGDPTWQITAADGSPGAVGGAYFAGIRRALAPPATGDTTTRNAKAALSKACRRARASRSRKIKRLCAATARRVARRSTLVAAKRKAAKSRATGPRSVQ